MKLKSGMDYQWSIILNSHQFVNISVDLGPPLDVISIILSCVLYVAGTFN